jgi:competence protein ComGC
LILLLLAAASFLLPVLLPKLTKKSQSVADGGN